MENQEAKRFFRKYGTIAITLQYSIAIIAIAFMYINFFVKLVDYFVSFLCVIIAFFLIKIVQFWYRAKIESITLKELNPSKMKAVLEIKGIYAYLPDRYLLAHFYNGDHQETIDMCNFLLKGKGGKYPWTYYRYLAGVYFQIGDIDSLKAVCEQFEACKATNSKIDLFCPLMKLYRLYASGKNEALKALYESEEKNQYNKATYMVCEYIHGVNFYTLGETEKAKEIFKAISEKAPLLGVGKLSAKQLENIERGEKYEINQIRIIPSEDYSLPTNAKKARVFSIIRACCIVLFVLLSILIIVASVKEDQKRKELERFEKELYSVIDESYDDFQVLTGFSLIKDGEQIEYMVAFESKENDIVVGYYVWNPHKQKNEFITYNDEIIVGKVYYDESPCTDYRICYQLFENEDDILGKCHKIQEFESDGQKLYLCIWEIYCVVYN